MSLGHSAINIIQKYNIYVMFVSWLIVATILLLHTIEKLSKNDTQDKKETFFLWGVGSTLVYNLTYFLNYQGLTGLSIYEPWIIAISLVPLLMAEVKIRGSTRRLKLVNILAILFLASLLVWAFTTLYFLVVYPPSGSSPISSRYKPAFFVECFALCRSWEWSSDRFIILSICRNL